MTAIEDILDFYKRSDADVLEALDGESAGVLWTLSSCSPDNLKQGIRQLMRCKATKIRWARKLRLNSRAVGLIEAVGIYLLPDMDQTVIRLADGMEIPTPLLNDPCLAAARATMQSITE